MRLGVLISGTGSNLRAIHRATADPAYAAEVVAVASDRLAAGIAWAREAGLPAEVIDRRAFPDRLRHEEAILPFLEQHRVEAVILAGYLRVLAGPLLQRYEGRILNIHPSLLPAFPGLHAPRQALEYGVRVTGVTVHLVDAGLDSGPIVLQEAVPVRDDDDEETLAERIHAVEHRLFPEAVRLLAEGRLDIRGRRVIIGKGDPA